MRMGDWRAQCAGLRTCGSLLCYVFLSTTPHAVAMEIIACQHPSPAQRVRGSTTGRPIMVLLDLLGRRMTLRILWELRDKNLTFRALQEAAETNPSVLNVRLKELREAHLVAPRGRRLRLEPHMARNCWKPSCRCTHGRISGHGSSTGSSASCKPSRPRNPPGSVSGCASDAADPMLRRSRTAG